MLPFVFSTFLEPLELISDGVKILGSPKTDVWVKFAKMVHNTIFGAVT